MSQQSYTATGIIHRIQSREQRGKYEIQNFVLEIPGFKEKKELARFELFGDKCDRIDPFREGQEASVEFNITGREHNGKFYTTLSAWKIVRPDQPHQENSRSSKPHDYKLEDRGQSKSAGSTYRGKNAYVPPADNSEDDLAF